MTGLGSGVFQSRIDYSSLGSLKGIICHHRSWRISSSLSAVCLPLSSRIAALSRLQDY